MTASAWTCGNCALDWPEPYCSLCGKQLTKLDLAPTNTEGATPCVQPSPPSASHSQPSPDPPAASTGNRPLTNTGARGKPVAGEATGARGGQA